MGYKIISTKTFEKTLRKLDRAVAKRVLAKIDKLKNGVEEIIRLHFIPKGLEGLCKYKIGEWRVFLWLNENKKEIILYRIGHRKEIYKNL
ncbi:MAG: type II toxin-antitoxin system RelE/ParE family toxin [Patescibacteria group bacterium]